MSTDKQVTVVIEELVQVSPDEYRMKRYSRNFSVGRPLVDMLNWAQSMGIKNASINDLQFYDYTGSSI